jgi:hypothetical protein
MRYGKDGTRAQTEARWGGGAARNQARLKPGTNS